jgi:hypothetical protein
LIREHFSTLDKPLNKYLLNVYLIYMVSHSTMFILKLVLVEVGN